MRDQDTLGRFKAPHKFGETPFTDTRDRCERLGYVPSHERIASLMAAGLQLQVTRDQLWDVVAKSDDEVIKKLGEDLPPIRRHLDTDLADLSQISRVYSYKRMLINDRIIEKRREEREKPAGVSPTIPNNETENAPVKP